MQRLFGEARLGPIGGGTSEILRNVICKRMGL
ncbi:MAG: acyl-CoA dehydrogenase family protein [Alphaproteobacteria bacterium]